MNNIWVFAQHLGVRTTFGRFSNIWMFEQHLGSETTFGYLDNIWVLINIWVLAPAESFSAWGLNGSEDFYQKNGSCLGKNLALNV